MNLDQFKKQRNKLIAKLALLAVEINEIGSKYAICDIAGHVNWVRCSVDIVKEGGKCGKESLFSFICHPFLSAFNDMSHEIQDPSLSSELQYEYIIADLQKCFNDMSKYLEF